MDKRICGLLTRCLITVWLMTFLSAASKNAECHSDNDVISCFHCTTTSLSRDHYCGDPFNASHPDLSKVQCKGYCVKWVLELTPGVMYYTRACSNAINIKMHKYLVCMKEGGSQRGHLCFCNHKECNGASQTSGSWSAILALTTLQLFLMNIFPT